MEKQNLSKLKKQDLINKKAGQNMSGEVSLSDELKGDKAFNESNMPKLFIVNDISEKPDCVNLDELDSYAKNKLMSEISRKTLDTNKSYVTTEDPGMAMQQRFHVTDLRTKVGKGKTSADGELSRIAESGPTFNNLMNFGQFIIEACDDKEENINESNMPKLFIVNDISEKPDCINLDELDSYAKNKLMSEISRKTLDTNKSYVTTEDPGMAMQQRFHVTDLRTKEEHNEEFDFDTLSLEEKKKLPAALQAFIDKKKGKKGDKKEKVKKGSKPDFLDLDKDGDKKEPMKKAAKK